MTSLNNPLDSITRATLQEFKRNQRALDGTCAACGNTFRFHMKIDSKPNESMTHQYEEIAPLSNEDFIEEVVERCFSAGLSHIAEKVGEIPRRKILGSVPENDIWRRGYNKCLDTIQKVIHQELEQLQK